MDEYSIIEQLDGSQIDQLHTLFKRMWWTKDRSMQDILTMLETSLSFGLIKKNDQKLVGYARVLTDQIKYAFIFDVMTDESFRGKGLGKLLMNAIITHPRLNNVKNFELTCKPELVDFYKQFGFSEDYGIVIPMRRA